MSDSQKNNADDFDRELDVISRAYKNAAQDAPSVGIDDAIRAAARRGVKSKPHVVGKSWVARWSAPLSAAALVVLSVSVGLIAIDEQPQLAPVQRKEKMQSTPPSPAAAPVNPLNDSASTAPSVALAPRASLPVPMIEKKALREQQNASPLDQIAKSAEPDLERRRSEAGGTASGTILSKDAGDALAFNRPLPAASPAPAQATTNPSKSVAKDAEAFASDPQRTGVAETAKREATQDKQSKSQLAGTAVTARGDSSAQAVPKLLAQTAASAPKPAPIVSNATAVAPPVYATPPAPQLVADKASELPEAWIKRILELKRLGKTRELDEEVAKFLKRYPDFVLPEELKGRK